mmetsp:Transcript_39068/g.62946  ORF Transcript_39068/g.62946 Transcript_39068/m.62946 type:complete len:81 (-) Transcript_39068:366-608(-)
MVSITPVHRKFPVYLCNRYAHPIPETDDKMRAMTSSTSGTTGLQLMMNHSTSTHTLVHIINVMRIGVSSRCEAHTLRLQP